MIPIAAWLREGQIQQSKPYEQRPAFWKMLDPQAWKPLPGNARDNNPDKDYHYGSYINAPGIDMVTDNTELRKILRSKAKHNYTPWKGLAPGKHEEEYSDKQQDSEEYLPYHWLPLLPTWIRELPSDIKYFYHTRTKPRGWDEKESAHDAAINAKTWEEVQARWKANNGYWTNPIVTGKQIGRAHV